MDGKSLLSNPSAGVPVTDRAPAEIEGFDVAEDMLLVRLPDEPAGGGHLRVTPAREGCADVFLDGLHLARVGLARGAASLSADAVVLMIDPGCAAG